MADITAPPQVCPKCNGNQFYDNTAPGAKKSPKGPDYKCKTQGCGEGFWLKAAGTFNAPRVTVKPVQPLATAGLPPYLAEQMQHEQEFVGGITAAARVQDMVEKYLECLEISGTKFGPALVKLVGNVTSEDIHAMATSLFIERNRARV